MKKVYTYIIIIIVSITILGNYLNKRGYVLSVEKLYTNFFNNDIFFPNNFKTEIVYEFKKNKIIILASNESQIALFSVDVLVNGFLYRYAGGVFGAHSVISKTGEELLMTSYGSGDKQTGFNSVGFKIDEQINYIDLQKYESSLFIKRGSYYLLLWTDGKNAPISIFTEDFIFIDHK